MRLKQLGWKFGLTREKRKELSDVLFETGIVNSKNHKEEKDYTEEGLGISIFTNNLPLGVAVASIMGEEEEFSISFKGQRTSFDLNDKRLFETLKTGDEVRIAYRECFEAAYDYIPPNFHEKQLLSRVSSGYVFVNAEKINAHK